MTDPNVCSDGVDGGQTPSLESVAEEIAVLNVLTAPPFCAGPGILSRVITNWPSWLDVNLVNMAIRDIQEVLAARGEPATRAWVYMPSGTSKQRMEDAGWNSELVQAFVRKMLVFCAQEETCAADRHDEMVIWGNTQRELTEQGEAETAAICEFHPHLVKATRHLPEVLWPEGVDRTDVGRILGGNPRAVLMLGRALGEVVSGLAAGKELIGIGFELNFAPTEDDSQSEDPCETPDPDDDTGDQAVCSEQ